MRDRQSTHDEKRIRLLSPGCSQVKLTVPYEIFLEPLRCSFREFIRGTIMNWWMFARLYERRIWLVQLVHSLVFTSSWDVDANCELKAIG